MQNGKVTIRNQLRPHLRVATEADCIYLSKRLRKEDYQENDHFCDLKHHPT